jgi:hypothetical protein
VVLLRLDQTLRDRPRAIVLAGEEWSAHVAEQQLDARRFGMRPMEQQAGTDRRHPKEVTCGDRLDTLSSAGTFL